MNERRWRWIVALAASLAGVICLAGCNLPTADLCNLATIDRPVVIAPAWDETVGSLTPTLSWSYADSDCPATRFEVTLGSVDVDVANGIGEVQTTSSTSLTWPEPLLGGHTYWWKVVAVVNTSSGEVRGLPNEAVMPFNTGPACEGGESLLAPVLMRPLDGGTVVSRAEGVGFAWDDPTACLPAGYELELSPVADMSAARSYPGELRTGLGVYSDETFTFEDCQRYYWRVRAQQVDGTAGAYSETWQFIYSSGDAPCVPTAAVPDGTCLWDTTARPIPLSPGWDETVDSLNPALAWTYADADCPASSFEVTVLRNGEDFALGEGVTYPSADASLTWPETLLPASSYYWLVRPVIRETSGVVTGPPFDALMPFSTGPDCSGIEPLETPILLLPEDGATLTRGDGVGFFWDDPSLCIPAPYTLEIATSEDFGSPVVFGGERRTDLGVYSGAVFAFEDCQQYYWRVQGHLDGGDAGPYSEVFDFTINTGSGACSALPTLVPGARLPEALTLQGAACRQGPGLDYPIIAYLEEGKFWQVVGRTQDRSWWQIEHSPTLRCWIASTLVEINGDDSQVGVPEIAPPYIRPTEVPFDCSIYATNASACNANQTCRWATSQQYPNGVCVNR